MSRVPALALLAVAFLSPPASACGLADVCRDVTSSLVGGVILDGLRPGVQRVRLSWSTDDEQPGAVAAYQLHRCDSSTCQPIVNVLPVGACGTDQAYEYVDMPPPPVERYSYRLDVVRVDGVVACSARVVPR